MDTSNIDDEVEGATHMYYHDMILQEIATRRVAATVAAAAAVAPSTLAAETRIAAAPAPGEQQESAEDGVVEVDAPAALRQ
jgi:hypothetical protein